MEDKSVVILGATSPIARALAAEYGRDGYKVIVGARDDEENETIAADLRVRFGATAHAAHWDATDFDGHAGFFEQCRDALGAVPTGVVFCAGYMDENEVAERDFHSAHKTIDVNFTCGVSTVNIFAAHFAERGAGFIAGVSSVAGDRGRQSNYIYGSSKAGFSTYLQGLRNRMYHHGVSVTTIKPGFVDTAMTYGTVDSPLVASPEYAARAMKRAIDNGRAVAYVPFFWRYIMAIIRAIPEWQFKKMKM